MSNKRAGTNALYADPATGGVGVGVGALGSGTPGIAANAVGNGGSAGGAGSGGGGGIGGPRSRTTAPAGWLLVRAVPKISEPWPVTSLRSAEGVSASINAMWPIGTEDETTASSFAPGALGAVVLAAWPMGTQALVATAK